MSTEEVNRMRLLTVNFFGFLLAQLLRSLPSFVLPVFYVLFVVVN